MISGRDPATQAVAGRRRPAAALPAELGGTSRTIRRSGGGAVLVTPRCGRSGAVLGRMRRARPAAVGPRRAESRTGQHVVLLQQHGQEGARREQHHHPRPPQPHRLPARSPAAGIAPHACRGRWRPVPHARGQRVGMRRQQPERPVRGHAGGVEREQPWAIWSSPSTAEGAPTPSTRQARLPGSARATWTASRSRSSITTLRRATGRSANCRVCQACTRRDVVAQRGHASSGGHRADSSRTTD